MTRRIALARPPETGRIDGIVLRDRRPLPEPGEVVVVQVYGNRRGCARWTGKGNVTAWS